MDEFIENVLSMIYKAKNQSIEGVDNYETLNDMDILVSKKAIDLGIVGKMSKSEPEDYDAN